jgi:hypothetical protein
MPDAAWCFVEALAGGKDEHAAFAATARRWNEREWSEGRDPWVQLALRGRDPFVEGHASDAAQFRTLARQLFMLLDEPGGAA